MRKAYSLQHAWELAYKLLDHDVEYDQGATQRAGYPLYTATNGGYAQVAELGDRIEVTNSESKSVNIWIVEENQPVMKDEERHEEISDDKYKVIKSLFLDTTPDAKVIKQVDTNGIIVSHIASNGKDWMCEQYIHGELMIFWTSASDERMALVGGKGDKECVEHVKFLRDEGWKFEGKENLKKAWERREKLKANEMLTWEEFQAEARKDLSDNPEAKAMYSKLASLIRAEKLCASGMLMFTARAWNAKSFNLNAIQTVELDNGKFATNTCMEVVSDDEAKCRVNEEFGFEAGQIKILGIPCYDATDYNFIRFECRGWSWLMMNGQIMQTFE